MDDGNDSVFGKMAFWAWIGLLFLIWSKPFSSDGIDWFKGTIATSKTEVNSDTWVPASRQEAESGLYEIKVYHGGRGTHQYWKKRKQKW